jgi:DNA polymerase-3 subunit delta
MKLASKNTNSYCLQPNFSMAGLLIYGVDEIQVSKKKKDFIDAIVGPSGLEEMRLSTLNTPDLRRDTTLLSNSIKLQAFFPGKRCIVIDDATDSITKALEVGITEWQPDDSYFVITAQHLTPRSTLRKLCELSNKVQVAALYDNPPTEHELRAELNKYKFSSVEPDALEEIMTLGRSLNAIEFSQTLLKISLFKQEDLSPLNYRDVKKCAPFTIESSIQDAIDIVASGKSSLVGPILAKLESQGINLIRLCTAMNQHFRKLYLVASDPSGPEAGVKKLRPPISFKRVNIMVRQVNAWSPKKLTTAISLLTDLDLDLRTTTNIPKKAHTERAVIRLSMLLKV